MQLKKGDRANLSKNGAALADAYDCHSTHFTGSILEEDLKSKSEKLLKNMYKKTSFDVGSLLFF